MELQARNGGDIYEGRKLGSWLKQAGFKAVHVSASYEVDVRGIPNVVQWIAIQH